MKKPCLGMDLSPGGALRVYFHCHAALPIRPVMGVDFGNSFFKPFYGSLRYAGLPVGAPDLHHKAVKVGALQVSDKIDILQL